MCLTMTAALTQSKNHIGQVLRARREAMGVSTTELAKALNMKPSFISAIEELSTTELPSIGYVLGYVRAYAVHVGLNGPDSVAQYKIDTETPENLGLRDRPHFVPKKTIRLPRGFVPAVLTVGCAVVVSVFISSAPTPERGQTRLAAAFENVGPNPTKTADVTEDNFVIKSIGPSWVQLRDLDGNVIMSRIMVSGESWVAPQDTGITVSARDGGALELYQGSTRIGPMGERGVPFAGQPLALPVDALLNGGDSAVVNLTALTLSTAQ